MLLQPSDLHYEPQVSHHAPPLRHTPRTGRVCVCERDGMQSRAGRIAEAARKMRNFPVTGGIRQATVKWSTLTLRLTGLSTTRNKIIVVAPRLLISGNGDGNGHALITLSNEFLVRQSRLLSCLLLLLLLVLLHLLPTSFIYLFSAEL